ncbi:hypothetical protein [Desulforhabdus amnigena]|jgi:hypothetical protein|uniref:DUF4829 domain-containing protein n=1 Tax=Desulforhabdus amnigena TaxID=40218 RepID=A0A9W6D5B7_9BACT|nr:hypothetical protein [Desulforhabdus amnigena]NLJ29974.1 hypothetical protein [Deltaproteobacteria bacterium]GLI34482.1 hypothetical protein DAMNIGENAA_19150 [Desulforhabdus amnigena]
MKNLAIVLSLFLTLLSFNTSSNASPLNEQQDALKQRAIRLWQARVEQDWNTEYGFLPNIEHNAQDQEKYASLMKKDAPYLYLSYQIGNIEISGDVAWIWTEYDVRPTQFPTYPVTHRASWEIWIKQGEAWYPVDPYSQERYPSLPPSQRVPAAEALLLQRANAYYDALEKEDIQALYNFFMPSFREKVPFDEFQQKRMFLKYLTHEIAWAQVNAQDPQIGRTMIKFTYRINDPNLTKLTPTEKTKFQEWVNIDGEWYIPGREDQE